MDFCLNCYEFHNTACQEVIEEIDRFFDRLPAPKARPVSEEDDKLLDLIERNMER